MSEDVELNDHDFRTIQKESLKLFLNMNKSSTLFDDAINEVIEKLLLNIKLSKERFEILRKSSENNPHKSFFEDLKIFNSNYSNLNESFNEKLKVFTEYINSKEQLESLLEMKIIYAFKTLENNIKKIVSEYLPLQNIKELSKWDYLIRYLLDKNIDIKIIENYMEINDLRKVNNAIKHSDNYKDSLIDIQEFKNSQLLTYENLNVFYERIKNSPDKFLEGLINEIYNELYVFDNKKIKKIAKSFLQRMEKVDAEKLINEIKNSYT